MLAPQRGMLVLMRGDRCLHSVAEVRGEEERICVVMAYDDGVASGDARPALDGYLYSGAPAAPGDPNYERAPEAR